MVKWEFQKAYSGSQGHATEGNLWEGWGNIPESCRELHYSSGSGSRKVGQDWKLFQRLWPLTRGQGETRKRSWGIWGKGWCCIPSTYRGCEGGKEVSVWGEGFWVQMWCRGSLGKEGNQRIRLTGRQGLGLSLKLRGLNKGGSRNWEVASSELVGQWSVRGKVTGGEARS